MDHHPRIHIKNFHLDPLPLGEAQHSCKSLVSKDHPSLGVDYPGHLLLSRLNFAKNFSILGYNFFFILLQNKQPRSKVYHRIIEGEIGKGFFELFPPVNRVLHILLNTSLHSQQLYA